MKIGKQSLINRMLFTSSKLLLKAVEYLAFSELLVTSSSMQSPERAHALALRQALN